MSDFALNEPRPGVLSLSGELTLQNARAVHEAFMGALAQHTNVEVDLLNVTKIDTAGTQLIIAVAADARAAGKTLRWLGFSLAVSEVIELLDLTELLGRPGAVVWG